MEHLVSFITRQLFTENRDGSAVGVIVGQLDVSDPIWSRITFSLDGVQDQNGNAVDGFELTINNEVVYRGTGLDAELISRLTFNIGTSDSTATVTPIHVPLVDLNDEAPFFGEVITPADDGFIFRSQNAPPSQTSSQTPSQTPSQTGYHYFHSSHDLANGETRHGVGSNDEVTITLLRDDGAIEITSRIHGVTVQGASNFNELYVWAVRRGDTWTIEAVDSGVPNAPLPSGADEQVFLYIFRNTGTLGDPTTYTHFAADHLDKIEDTNRVFRKYAPSVHELALNENVAAGTVVHTLAEAVADTATAQLTYSMLETGDHAYFTFNAATRQLAFKASPDYETLSEYRVTVQATATDGSLTQTATQTVIIRLNNLDDNDPVFAPLADQGLVLGDDGTIRLIDPPATDHSGVIFTARASDADDDIITYRITAGNEDGIFIIDAATGEVRFAGGHHTFTQSHTLTIEAGSHFEDAQPKTATQTVAIDMRPPVPFFGEFITAWNNGFIYRAQNEQETSHKGHHYFHSSHDLTHGTIRYGVIGQDKITITLLRDDGAIEVESLIHGLPGVGSTTDGDFFVWAIRHGDIWTLKATNSVTGTTPTDADEVVFLYTFRSTGTATNPDTKSHFETELLLRITDTSLKFKKHNPAASEVKVDENQAAATVIYTLEQGVIDSTTARLTYAMLEEGDHAYFTFDAATRRLTAKSSLDYEDLAEYRVTLQLTATDASDKQITTQTVVIRLNNLDDNAPIFAPLADQGLVLDDESNISLEGVLATDHSGVIFTALATDADGEAVTYAITAGNDAGVFTIDATTGEVTLTDDYHSFAESVTLTITATSQFDATSQAKTATQSVIIDVPPPTPFFGEYVTTGENSTGEYSFVFRAQNQPLTQAGGGDTGHHYFHANRDLTNGTTRYGTANNDPITITLLRDTGAVEISGYINGLSHVGNTNENSRFIWAVKRGNLWTLEAVDGDTGNTPTGADDQVFLYTFRSTGLSFKPKTHTRFDTYLIEKIETEGLRFKKHSPSERLADIDENAAAGTSVFTLEEATIDSDTAQLTYSMMEIGDHAHFTFDTATRRLTANSSFDYEEKTEYSVTLQVAVMDGDETQIITQTVTISVNNIDDNAPVFAPLADQGLVLDSDGNIGLIEPVATDHSGVLFTVLATDADGDDVRYNITSGNESRLFTLHELTGEVRVAYGQTLTENLTLTITATSQSHWRIPPQTATQTVHINVVTTSSLKLSETSATLAEDALTDATLDLATVTILNNSGYTLTTSDDRFTVIDGKLKVAAGKTVDFDTLDSPQITITVIGLKPGHPSITADFVLTVEDSNDTPPTLERDLISADDNFIYNAVILPGGRDKHHYESDFLLHAPTTVNRGASDTDPVTFTLYHEDGPVTITGAIEGYDPETPRVNFIWAVRTADGWSLMSTSGTGANTPPTTLASGVTIDEVYFLYSVAITTAGVGNIVGPTKLATGTTLTIAESLTPTINIDEDTASGSVIYTAPRAVADIAGATITYELLATGDHALFRFDPTNGTLTTVTTHDADQAGADLEFTVTLRISATSGSGAAARTQFVDQILTIRIVDIDDRPPVFDRHQDADASESVAVAVSEDIDEDTIIYTAAATDPEGQGVVYSIVSSSEDLFRIDAATGAIYLKDDTIALDFEGATTSYKITVAARSDDRGIISTRNEVIDLTVTDANDIAPRITTSALSIDGNRQRVITLTESQLDYTDMDTVETPADQVTYTILTLPTGIDIYNDRVLVTTGSTLTFTHQDLLDGKIQLAITDPAAIGNFTLKISDGVNTNATPATFTITVRPEHAVTTPEDANTINLSSSDTGHVIISGDGSDTIIGSSGDDLITAGRGDDTIYLDQDTTDSNTGGSDRVIYRFGFKRQMIASHGGDKIYGFRRGEDIFHMQIESAVPQLQTLDGFFNFITAMQHPGFDVPLLLTPNITFSGDADSGYTFSVMGFTINFQEIALHSSGRLSHSVVSIYYDTPLSWQEFLDLIAITRPDGTVDINYDYGLSAIVNPIILSNLLGDGSLVYERVNSPPNPIEVPSLTIRSGFQGTDSDELILGTTGADVINGGGGGDVIFAGKGADTITLGLGGGEAVIIYRFESGFTRTESSKAIDGGDVVNGFLRHVHRLVLADTNTLEPLDSLDDFSQRPEQIKVSFVYADNGNLSEVHLTFGGKAPSATNTLKIALTELGQISPTRVARWDGLTENNAGFENASYLNQIFDNIDIVSVSDLPSELEIA